MRYNYWRVVYNGDIKKIYRRGIHPNYKRMSVLLSSGFWHCISISAEELRDYYTYETMEEITKEEVDKYLMMQELIK